MRHASMLIALALAGCKLDGVAQWSSGSTARSPSRSPSPSPSPSRSPSQPSATSRPSIATYAEDEDPATSQQRHVRRRYVSTKASAAQLGGLPGQRCTHEEEAKSGLAGACWDPPGTTDAAPFAHIENGVRLVQPPEVRHMVPEAVYWIDMPREAVVKGSESFPHLRDAAGELFVYAPHAIQGYDLAPFPRFSGRPLREVLAQLDALDLGFVVTVRWRQSCAGAQDTVCTDVDPPTGHVQLGVAMRIRQLGTADEQREIPEGIQGMKTEDAVAALKAIGFTNVVVVEKDLPCPRGVVCSTYRPGWHKTNQAIELSVRRAR